MTELARIIECLLFVAGEPLTVKELAKTTEAESAAVVEALHDLQTRYRDSGLQVLEIAGGFQMSTRTQYAPSIGKLLAPNANRLSRPSLETVTIIAYQQPCTQAEVEAIRGVSVDGVLKTLMERELIEEVGRKQTPGRPILYGTTDFFLHYFGLSSVDALPKLEDDEAYQETIAETQAMAHTALHAAGVE
jgi:segregation and condensation protein B